jgi:hypothetical protein
MVWCLETVQAGHGSKITMKPVLVEAALLLAALGQLAMLVIPGGEERTEEECRNLCAGAGFRLTRIVPTRAEVGVIEGQKV